MDNIFESCIVNNLRSERIVFKGRNNTYNSIEEYIAEEYVQRSLYMRDMIIARDERPQPKIERVSETGSETNVTVLTISFATPVHLFRNEESPYAEVDLLEKITCNKENGVVITHVPTDSRTVWTINITSSTSLTGDSITLAANTFVNMYGNGNEEVVKILSHGNYFHFRDNYATDIYIHFTETFEFGAGASPPATVAGGHVAGLTMVGMQDVYNLGTPQTILTTGESTTPYTYSVLSFNDPTHGTINVDYLAHPTDNLGIAYDAFNGLRVVIEWGTEHEQSWTATLESGTPPGWPP
jgi:hypothetical protein